MILSRANNFIFVKTRKTAGTSLEIALSKVCGDEDVITALPAREEAYRMEVGGRGAQNNVIPFSRYSRSDWVRTLATGRRRKFTEHTTATEIRDYLGRDSWDQFYTFAVERNPWDKVVSFYWWCGGDSAFGNIRSFLEKYYYLPQGFDMYSKGGRVIVNEVLLYEDLDEALPKLSSRLGLPGPVSIKDIRAKASYRQDRRHYREILDTDSAEMIRKIYIREITHFGYTF